METTGSACAENTMLTSWPEASFSLKATHSIEAIIIRGPLSYHNKEHPNSIANN